MDNPEIHELDVQKKKKKKKFRGDDTNFQKRTDQNQ
jgi:hypothetical protein